MITSITHCIFAVPDPSALRSHTRARAIRRYIPLAETHILSYLCPLSVEDFSLDLTVTVQATSRPPLHGSSYLGTWWRRSGARIGVEAPPIKPRGPYLRLSWERWHRTFSKSIQCDPARSNLSNPIRVGGCKRCGRPIPCISYADVAFKDQPRHSGTRATARRWSGVLFSQRCLPRFLTNPSIYPSSWIYTAYVQ